MCLTTKKLVRWTRDISEHNKKIFLRKIVFGINKFFAMGLPMVKATSIAMARKLYLWLVAYPTTNKIVAKKMSNSSTANHS